MKEADEGIGGSNAAGPAEPDKADKDMKGLVYQGHSGGDSAPPKPVELYPDGEGPEPKRGKDEEMSAESSTILNFTESDTKLRTIAIMVIVALVIVGIAYFVLHSKVSVPVTIKTTSTIGKNAPTTTVGPNYNRTVIANLDILYNYTGPKNSTSNLPCGETRFSDVQSYVNRLNASATFLLQDTENSHNCQLTISKIVATTPGFKVLTVSPSTPDTIPSNSSTQLVITIRAPPFNYTGPLSLTIDEN
jgi:hypothetical protein